MNHEDYIKLINIFENCCNEEAKENVLGSLINDLQADIEKITEYIYDNYRYDYLEEEEE